MKTAVKTRLCDFCSGRIRVKIHFSTTTGKDVVDWNWNSALMKDQISCQIGEGSFQSLPKTLVTSGQICVSLKISLVANDFDVNQNLENLHKVNIMSHHSYDLTKFWKSVEHNELNNFATICGNELQRILQ